MEGRKEQHGKEGEEKGYGENWVVKIQGMLRRLQADTHKVKTTFKSHVLSVLFLFYWFLTLHQAMYF